MTRRLVALALWTYFSWYLGAMLAAFTNDPAVVAPAAAVVTAAVGVIGWARTLRRDRSGVASTELQPTH